MKISQATRRDISDSLVVEKVSRAGRLEEPQFLARLFDLSALPSLDSRFDNAAGDIWQHRINSPYDWDDDWVFYDRRFDLLNCDDDLFLRFLAETLHPIVRSDPSEATKLLQLYNNFLRDDGFELVEATRISDRPIYVGRPIGITSPPGVAAVRQTFKGSDATYVTQQITRMETAVGNDPDLAIGTAKELLETCCKTLLEEFGIEPPKSADLPQLVKLTVKELKLTPDDISDSAKAATTIRRLLSNLATITQGIVELRNQYGTGHGKAATSKGLTSRHAKLAVGAASTLAVFLLETHEVRKRSLADTTATPT